MTSLYDLTVPFLTNALKAQQHLISKAESFGTVSVNDLLESRLAEDMWPLNQQFTITALHATMCVLKLTGAQPNQVNYGPASLEDAKKYLAETLKTLEGVTPESINGKEDKIVGAMMGPGNEVSMKAIDYVLGYLIPNVFFHLTTAYDILRMKGVPLGKADFLSGFVKVAK
ncbi:hypothetical protein F5Y01DRAFT_169562 [Xylaria sp. FL0043]|nr:hypothetical protein F5Y01DRAFT_169562 [Xylaria sp. FL0043]